MQASIGARARAGAGSLPSSSAAFLPQRPTTSSHSSSSSSSRGSISAPQCRSRRPTMTASTPAPSTSTRAAATDAAPGSPPSPSSPAPPPAPASIPSRPPVPGLHATRLIGVGSSVPATVLTNADLARLVDTNDEWITSRTGIKRRHVLAPGEGMTKHAAAAALRALEMAGLAAADVDLVVLCTSTPDDAFGGAGQLQAAIGAHSAVAFDVTGACSGFVLGLVTAAQYLRTGLARRAVVVGGDALSRITDWTDRGTCILFGDGCGAVVLASADAVPEGYAASEAGREGAAKAAAAAARQTAAAAAAAATASAASSSGAPPPIIPAGVRGRGPPGCAILGVDMRSDGRGHKSLTCVHADPSATDAKAKAPAAEAGSKSQYANIAMAGQDVFKFAVRSVPAVIDSALDVAGVSKEEVDWLVMHQANARILDAAAARLGLPAERVVTNLAEYGNTSAASIPLALDGAVRGGKVRAGDVMAMAGFGAGLTWVGAVVRWG